MSESFSSLNENKRVETLFRLSPTSTASVKCLNLKSGRCFTVFSTGNKLLHVMKNHKIYCVIDIGSCILKILDSVDEKELKVWVVTKDGKLWTIPIPPLQEADEQNIISSKSQQANYQAAKASPNHEIFAELLGDDNLPSSSDGYKPVSPFCNVCKCSDDSVVYWEPGLQDVAIGSHHMIACSSNDQDVRLTVYPWIEQHNAGIREIASNFLYQISLPRDACNHSNNHVTSLLYVWPSEQLLSAFANSTLDQQLFSALFASQSEDNFPIVLVGFRSGFVGFLPVGVRNNNANLKTVYHLEQPVVSIFSTCLKPPLPKGVNPDKTPTGNALVILGALGKLVLITQDKSKGLLDSILIREYHVPGAIACAALNHNLNILFYSTLKEVYIVKLGFKTECKSGDKNANSCTLPPSLLPTSLNIPKVLALTVSNEPDSIICLKSDGRVLHVVKALTEEYLGSLQCSTVAASMPSGEKIKKHLEEIHEKACHVQKLRDEIHQLDDVIKQLNNVTQVLCEILRTQESQNDSTFQESCRAGISFKVDVDYEAQGTSLNSRVILRCDLKNETRFSFSPNWSLVVQVGTTQPWFNENCSAQSTKNHSVSLSAASVHHISIPMENSLTYLAPIQVSCYVCFGLKALLPVFLKDTEPDLAEEGLTVLVSRTELNILSFLRKQETCSSATHGRKHPTCLLQNTLKSLTTNWVPNEASKLVQDKTFSTFSIRLSKEAVDFIQKRVENLSEKESESHLKQTYKSNQEARKDNVLSQEACVLQFILRSSRAHLYGDDMKCLGGRIVVRTPSEEVVKFQVVKLDQVGTTGSMEGLEVRVHTSSQVLGCAAHSALLKVLKPVLQRSPEENASIPVVELQKQLIKLKELQTSLDLMRPSVQSEESIEDRRHEAVIRKLISIYCDLRKIPTIMP